MHIFKTLLKLTFLCGIFLTNCSYASANDESDCSNKSIPVRRAMEACLHLIKKAKGGVPGNVTLEKTSIIGYFSGCDQEKIYKLLNGRILECHTVFTHSETSPEVEILSDVRVIIDGESSLS